MKNVFVWFWVYYVLVDRLVSLGYLNTFLTSIGWSFVKTPRTFKSIIDVVWSLPNLPDMWAIFDVWIVATVAWFLVVIGRPLSRTYMFFIWWVLIFYFWGWYALNLYTRFITNVVERPVPFSWYYHPTMMLFGWVVLSFQATKFIRYLMPILFLQSYA